MSDHPPRAGNRFTVAAVAATLVVLTLAPAAAWAHGDGESSRAFDLVRQAIALIVNKPDDTMTIDDKINGALAAEDTSGVQIPLVQQAKDALAADDIHRARALLEQSIGARVHTSGADPVAIGQAPPPVTGADTGTIAAIDAMPGRGGFTGGDWALVAISVVFVLLGAGLSIRRRPARRTSAHGEVTR